MPTPGLAQADVDRPDSTQATGGVAPAPAPSVEAPRPAGGLAPAPAASVNAPQAAGGTAPASVEAADPANKASERVREMLRKLPDYTCVMTIEREVHDSERPGYRRLDPVRLEIAYLDQDELYAWPGSSHFEARNLQALLGGEGASGTGDFALHLKATYFGQVPLVYKGEETVHGRRLLKFSQHVPRPLSGYTLGLGEALANTAYDVTTWHEPQSYALVRFELQAVNIPKELGLRRCFKAIEYQDVSVAGTKFRLPARTELWMSATVGGEARTVTTYRKCREYLGESTLLFPDEGAAAEAGATSAKAASAASRAAASPGAATPAGLSAAAAPTAGVTAETAGAAASTGAATGVSAISAKTDTASATPTGATAAASNAAAGDASHAAAANATATGVSTVPPKAATANAPPTGAMAAASNAAAGDASHAAAANATATGVLTVPPKAATANAPPTGATAAASNAAAGNASPAAAPIAPRAIVSAVPSNTATATAAPTSVSAVSSNATAAPRTAAPNSLMLKAGLRVESQFENGFDFAAAAVGDLVELKVSREVVDQGKTVVPAGATIEARITGVRCGSDARRFCFAILAPRRIVAGGREGPFAARMEAPGLEAEWRNAERRIGSGHSIALPRELLKVREGTPVLMQALTSTLPRGYTVVWRTLEVRGESAP